MIVSKNVIDVLGDLRRKNNEQSIIDVLEALPTIIMIAGFIIFGPMYIMRIWSKYLFYEDIKLESKPLSELGKRLQERINSGLITGKEMHIAWCDNTDNIEDALH